VTVVHAGQGCGDSRACKARRAREVFGDSSDDRAKGIMKVVRIVVRIYGSRASGVFVIYVHCGILCVRNCQ
jgi:hypothetical protein